MAIFECARRLAFQVKKDLLSRLRRGRRVYTSSCREAKMETRLKHSWRTKTCRSLRSWPVGWLCRLVCGSPGRRLRRPKVNSNDPNVALVDNCDPATFNAAIPGVCATTPHRHDTPFLEFVGLLFSPLAKNIIGHPAWHFAPGYISIRAGQTVRVTNAGGEGHTFTEVIAFGGGFVPLLNGVGGPAGTVPLETAAACLPPPGTVAPVIPSRSRGFPPGCTSSSAVSTPGCAR